MNRAAYIQCKPLGFGGKLIKGALGDRISHPLGIGKYRMHQSGGTDQRDNQ